MRSSRYTSVIGKIVGRFLAGVEAFSIGRAVGKHVDKKGLDLDDELRDQLQGVMGKEGRWAFAAGLVTLGWAFLTRKELILLFLAGLLVGYGAFAKLMELLRGPALAASYDGTLRPTVDTTTSVN